MKNNKGESQVGLIVLMAVAIIVAVAFLPSIFSGQSQMTNTVNVQNLSVTLDNAGTYVAISDYQNYEGTLVFYNNSVDIVSVNPANFTVTSSLDTTVNKILLKITPVGKSTYNSSVINVSGTFEPQGYVTDSGTRSIAGIIGLFAVLALLAGAIYYWAKQSGFLSNF